MWVRFTSDFDWRPPERKGTVTVAYRAGMTKYVRKACAEAAIAAGKAQPTDRPDGEVDPQEEKSNGAQ
jgi:hypothetical protein